MTSNFDNLVGDLTAAADELEQAFDDDDIYAWDEYTVQALVELIAQEAGNDPRKLRKYAKYVADWINDENDERVVAARSLVPHDL